MRGAVGGSANGGRGLVHSGSTPPVMAHRTLADSLHQTLSFSSEERLLGRPELAASHDRDGFVSGEFSIWSEIASAAGRYILFVAFLGEHWAGGGRSRKDFWVVSAIAAYLAASLGIPIFVTSGAASPTFARLVSLCPREAREPSGFSSGVWTVRGSLDPGLRDRHREAAFESPRCKTGRLNAGRMGIGSTTVFCGT